jgi:hypothetical protein
MPDVAGRVVGSVATRASGQVVPPVAATDVTCSVVGTMAVPYVAGRVVGSVLGDGDAAAGYCCGCDRGC